MFRSQVSILARLLVVRTQLVTWIIAVIVVPVTLGKVTVIMTVNARVV